MISIIYKLLNALCLGAYGAGLGAVSTFLTNTRVIGVRDSKIKSPAIMAALVGLPAVGLTHVLLSGGLGRFLASLMRPFSRSWAWRAGFTLMGARYLAQEIWRHRHPPVQPEEVLCSKTREVDMREEIAVHEGVDLAWLGGLLFRANDLYRLEVATQEIRLKNLPPQFDGFTIAQVSDLHYGHFISTEFIRRYIALVIDVSPDMIALTGDYQQYREDIWRAARELRPLAEWSRRERHGEGVVAIMGNHDTWAGTVDVTEAVRRAGIMVLNNHHVELKRDGASLYIAGVADPWSLRADLDRTLLGVPENACVVLLAHEPDYLVESAQRGVDLQLSGHLHGGQIKLPFVGAVLSPSRYNRRYIEGFYKREETLMFVSRGLGGHPPVRYACKPQIALLVLRASG
jgi:predicted MPP superfamily phosphohydrolase